MVVLAFFFDVLQQIGAAAVTDRLMEAIDAELAQAALPGVAAAVAEAVAEELPVGAGA